MPTSSQDDALREIANSLSDFREDIAGKLGTLIEGQRHVTETLVDHKQRMDKQDEKVESHTKEIAQANGGIRVTKWIGSAVAGAIAVAQALHILGGKH